MDYRVLFAAPLAALVMSVSATEPRLPSPWTPWLFATVNTDNPPDYTKGPPYYYDIGVDSAAEDQGLRSLSIKSVGKLNAEDANMGAVQQYARGYGGKRLRFSGQIRSEGVRIWAGLYMDEVDIREMHKLAHGWASVEKMLPPNGASGQAPYGAWQDVSVVVQVPATVNTMNLGLALVGEGKVWARKLHFEVVGPEVLLTSTRMLGFDWAKARDKRVRGEKGMSFLPPQPLTNLAFN